MFGLRLAHDLHTELSNTGFESHLAHACSPVYLCYHGVYNKDPYA
jgi:hypothetical protein